MKRKTIIAALALSFFTLSSFAFKKGGPASQKEVTIDTKYQKITVGSNIKLVLIENSVPDMVSIAGPSEAINNISVKVVKGEMLITSSRNTRPGSITVYVPAKDVSRVYLNQGAVLSGQEGLEFNDLTVFVNVDSRLDLKVFGNVKVQQADDCEFIYEKKEINPVLVVKK